MKTTDLAGPVVIGFDQSEQSARAAALGWAMSQSFGADAHYVHAVRDRWAEIRALAIAAAGTASASPMASVPTSTSEPGAKEKKAVRAALLTAVPEDTDPTLHLETGRAASVLTRYADRVDASLIVVGGKHHASLSRWTIGSTANDLVRTCNKPVLVVGDAPASISRVLAAVDLSSAAPDVLRFAEHLAANLEAAILGLHVVNHSLPGLQEDYGLNEADVMTRATALADERLWSTMTHPRAEHIVRAGSVGECICQEIKKWDADLVVVGSHGHGWEQRMLLGSTTEGLVNDLPTSVLIYPIS